MILFNLNVALALMVTGTRRYASLCHFLKSSATLTSLPSQICTYVVDGNLTHQDSMGTSETLGPGAVQFMTAGTGVQHSEHNLAERPLRFIQMWLSVRTACHILLQER